MICFMKQQEGSDWYLEKRFQNPPSDFLSQTLNDAFVIFLRRGQPSKILSYGSVDWASGPPIKYANVHQNARLALISLGSTYIVAWEKHLRPLVSAARIQQQTGTTYVIIVTNITSGDPFRATTRPDKNLLYLKSWHQTKATCCTTGETRGVPRCDFEK